MVFDPLAVELHSFVFPVDISPIFFHNVSNGVLNPPYQLNATITFSVNCFTSKLHIVLSNMVETRIRENGSTCINAKSTASSKTCPDF